MAAAEEAGADEADTEEAGAARAAEMADAGAVAVDAPKGVATNAAGAEGGAKAAGRAGTRTGFGKGPPDHGRDSITRRLRHFFLALYGDSPHREL